MNVEKAVASPAELAAAFARRLEALAGTAGGKLSLALPGGSVADIFFPVLARCGLDWGLVDVFWGDERAVPASHADSNYAAAQRLLLGPVGAPASRVHRMPADAADLEAAAAAYEAELKAALGEAGALDVALLGMGPDGHVCSLFEGHRALAASGRLVIPITDSPKPPPCRLTLTLEALRAARLVVVAAFGAAKAEVVRSAVTDPRSALPVAIVLRQARQAALLLDEPAAARLTG